MQSKPAQTKRAMIVRPRKTFAGTCGRVNFTTFASAGIKKYSQRSLTYIRRCCVGICQKLTGNLNANANAHPMLQHYGWSQLPKDVLDKKTIQFEIVGIVVTKAALRFPPRVVHGIKTRDHES